MRRLLIVDSSVSTKSPTMRSWLAAAREVIPQRFDEVEIWAFQCELKEPWVNWIKVRPVTTRWAIQSLFYDRVVRRLMNQRSSKYLGETLVQSTGTHLVSADIRYIQFWNSAYAEAAEDRPEFLHLPLKDRLLGQWWRRSEQESLMPGRSGEWWCVSRGIAEPIIRDSPEPPIVRYLPNAYDPSRFNRETRMAQRAEVRNRYGLSDHEVVFAFSAFGHFERKGLRQATEAIAALAAKGLPARLLVIGGNANAIRSFRKQMITARININPLIFAGLVNNIEHHLSAADAFLMPSHFEAFSLAEIEAGALGLRLYLTAHPGHEMILREGANGRLLPWDPAGMASVLEEEIQSGIVGVPHNEIGEALDPRSYAAAMAANYDAAISRKWGTQRGEH